MLFLFLWQLPLISQVWALRSPPSRSLPRPLYVLFCLLLTSCISSDHNRDQSCLLSHLHVPNAINKDEYWGSERRRCSYLMAKAHRDIWGKAIYVNHKANLNFNRLTNPGYSLTKIEWLDHNVQYLMYYLKINTHQNDSEKTHWCKFHWIIHVCISCVVTEPESTHNLLHSFVSFM